MKVNTPEEQAQMDAMEARSDAPESLRWRIAVAVNDKGAYCGNCDYEDGLNCPECRSTCLEYAEAALRVVTEPADPT